jgi:hypothetical protein
MTGTAQQLTSAPPLFSRRAKVIVAALALGLVAWLGTAWLGRSQVEVVAAEQLLTCQGTEVVMDKAIGDSAVQMPYAVVSEQMRCVLRFQVENRGPLPVRVHRISVLWYGPDRGSDAEAVLLSPGDVEPIRREHHPDGDAVFALDAPQRILGGEATEYNVELIYRPPGCRGGDKRSAVPDSPAVRVSVLGIPGDRVLAGDSLGLKCVRR